MSGLKQLINMTYLFLNHGIKQIQNLEVICLEICGIVTFPQHVGRNEAFQTVIGSFRIYNQDLLASVCDIL